MKHKHYDCIVAWANGKNIETSRDGLVWSFCQVPAWSENVLYRVEKAPVIEVQYFQSTGIWYEAFEPELGQAWHLKVTYQDGKAIKAELPKDFTNDK